MIDYDVLEEFDTHSLRLEAVFTAKPGALSVAGEQLWEKQYEADGRMTRDELADKLFAARKSWEQRIQDRIENGRSLSMRHYRNYMVSDLAFDSTPVTPDKFAHMLYANGDMVMDFEELYTEVVKESGAEIADEIFIRDKQNPHNVVGINTPKLSDFTINLVRPYIRRAVAAQVNRYENLYPFLKYSSRSQGLVGRLRADILSEMAEIMTDQFGYRHLLAQEIRGMFLHSHSVSFVENSWSVTEQMAKVNDPADPRGWRMREKIERQGVRFKKVHPTRVFYDSHHPVSSINFDGGCQYIGYWDVIQYKDMYNRSDFFNTDQIPYSSTLHNFKKNYTAYFSQYYASTMKHIMDRPVGAERNSRDANAHEFYSDSIQDDCLWLTHYYERVVPKQEGLGGYPYPCWVHLIVAGDNTVVFAEILPSRPAYCLHYDENDERLFNNSMALDILPYQDQVSNLYSQVLYLLQIQNLMILALDSDVVSEEIREDFKKLVQGRKLFDQVHLLEFDSKIEELFEQDLSQKRPIQIFQAETKNVINDLMRGIYETIRLLERNQMMSPNEMGQFVERETSATEVQQVSTTSGDLHSFKSSGIDEARQAMKVILYESMLACGSNKIKISVPERYPDPIIEQLGFAIDDTGSFYDANEQLNLIGTKEALVGELVFSSRDGAERVSNTESAKILMELMRYVMSSEISFKILVNSFGMEQISKALSEIFRLAGSPITLKLPAGFDEEAMKEQADQNPEQTFEAIQAILQQMDGRLQQVEQVAQDYVSQEQTKQQQALGAIARQPQAPPRPVAPPQQR